jgi:hypothetical protein
VHGLIDTINSEDSDLVSIAHIWELLDCHVEGDEGFKVFRLLSEDNKMSKLLIELLKLNLESLVNNILS